MNRAVIFIFQVTVALALSSCVELIDLSPREGRSLVVNCILTESDVQTLEMYYTTQKLGEEGEPVNDAKVTLCRVNDPVAEFYRCDDGLWRADFCPEYGAMYRLKLTVGERDFIATTIFPKDIQVDCYGRRRWSDNSRRRISYLMYSYELRLYDEEFPKPPYKGRECLWESHLWIFPKDMGWGDDYQKYIATSHFCADDFNLTSLYVRDLPCFSKDSINVMDKWLKEQLAWYPAKLGDLQLHQGFVRIDIPKDYRSGQPQEELTDTPVYSDKSFALARPFPTSWPNNDGPYQEQGGLYDIYILSDEADHYFKDVYRKHLNKDNFLFEYDTENVYSNIEGGIGVFGAMIHRSNKSGVRGYLDDFVQVDN